jgi:hypothetical protein
VAAVVQPCPVCGKGAAEHVYCDLAIVEQHTALEGHLRQLAREERWAEMTSSRAVDQTKDLVAWRLFRCPSATYLLGVFALPFDMWKNERVESTRAVELPADVLTKLDGRWRPLTTSV